MEKIKILEYDEVDPLEVLQINLLGLDFSLTPERVSLIREYDPRPFPFFALYAVEGGHVIGQVGVFRLPMVTNEGLEDVGGIWAVCTLPTYQRHGIATVLMDEAHERMREEGLRFSTLGTSKFRVAHQFYLKLGYQDTFSPSTLLFQREKVFSSNNNIQVEQADFEKLYLADKVFREISEDFLGFARRHEPFLPAMVAIGELAIGKLNEENIWLIWKRGKLIGYLIAKLSGSVLQIIDLTLLEKTDAIYVISALSKHFLTPYIQVKSNHPSITRSLLNITGIYEPQDWSCWMLKPLIPDVVATIPEELFGIASERFLFSGLDST